MQVTFKPRVQKTLSAGLAGCRLLLYGREVRRGGRARLFSNRTGPILHGNTARPTCLLAPFELWPRFTCFEQERRALEKETEQLRLENGPVARLQIALSPCLLSLVALPRPRSAYPQQRRLELGTGNVLYITEPEREGRGAIEMLWALGILMVMGVQ